MIYLRGHHLRLLYGYMHARNNEFSLQVKKERILATAIDEGHSISHGKNIIETLEKVFEPGAKIQVLDSIDDICSSCDRRNERACKEFIPYGISATADDRGTLGFYGLQKKIYTTEFLQKRILEKGRF